MRHGKLYHRPSGSALIGDIEEQQIETGVMYRIRPDKSAKYNFVQAEDGWVVEYDPEPLPTAVGWYRINAEETTEKILYRNVTGQWTAHTGRNVYSLRMDDVRDFGPLTFLYWPHN